MCVTGWGRGMLLLRCTSPSHVCQQCCAVCVCDKRQVPSVAHCNRFCLQLICHLSEALRMLTALMGLHRYLAGWGYLLSYDAVQLIVSKVDLYEQQPDTAPGWYPGLHWEDVLIGLLLHEFAEPQNKPDCKLATQLPAVASISHSAKVVSWQAAWCMLQHSARYTCIHAQSTAMHSLKVIQHMLTQLICFQSIVNGKVMNCVEKVR